MTKEIRILILSRAGFEKMNRAVYRELARDPKVELHLIVPSSIELGKSIRLKKPDLEENFPVSGLEPIGNNLRLQRLAGLRKFIAEYQPTHLLAEWDPASLVAWDILRTQNSVPFETWLLTCENLPKNYRQEFFRSLARFDIKGALRYAFILFLMGHAVKRVSKVFTINEVGTRFLRQLGFKEVVQIPLGYDPKYFFKQSPTKIRSTRRRLKLSKPTIGFFGRIAPEKGLDLLLDALSGLEDLPWQLMIDQFKEYDSPYARSLHSRLKKLTWKKRVVTFSAKHHEIPDYMNAVDYVVLPSRELRGISEQYGRVLAEAMACGKVVVGSNCGAIPWIIGDAGYLFPENDLKKMTETLRHVLTAPKSELAKKRGAAMKRAREELSSDKQAAIWLEHLKDQKGSLERVVKKAA